MNEITDKTKTNAISMSSGAKPAVAPPVVTTEAEAPVETVVEKETFDSPQDAIDHWVSRYVNGTVLSRDTAAYNYLIEQLPALASMIEEGTK